MDKPLWTPSQERVNTSHMQQLLERMQAKHGFSGEGYDALHRWSVERLEDFWGEMLLDTGMVTSSPSSSVLTTRAMPQERIPGNEVWFPGLRFNFAQQLLRFREERPAVIAIAEGKARRVVSFNELYAQVARCRSALVAWGVEAGDRIAGFLPNAVEPIVAMLAASSIGAVWSSTSPDFGFKGVMDRFGQIEPKVLFCTNGYRYNGKGHSTVEKASQIARDISSLQKVVVVPFLESESGQVPGAITWEEMMQLGEERMESEEIPFAQLPFDHPQVIVYSSGTTGVPKCIVHGQGGMLLKQHTEHKYHVDLGVEDTLFYFTTCGWMMWNWLVAGLAQGATIVAYDGSPTHPDGEQLFRMATQEGITIFGTSPKFLAACAKAGLRPGETQDLSKLRTVLSTGSPLEAGQFRYVYDAIKSDLHLASISGGTDICGCFMAGVPTRPVYAGEIQGACLGVDLISADEAGEPLIGEQGELVCRTPLPSMPVHFWRDPGMEKFRRAYFETFPGLWHHGDFITINDRGGVVVFGRSDATLNPGGVRIGTAEIYRIVEEMPFVLDSLVVGHQKDGDVQVVLFVVMREGNPLTDQLAGEIRNAIRAQATPRHVPAVIHQINEVPVTISGKKVEIAVAGILRGEVVKNRDALANPEALEQFSMIHL